MKGDSYIGDSQRAISAKENGQITAKAGEHAE
jgi:hypothetical protein